MKCCRFKHLLPLFLDGQLSKEETSKIQSHLQKCLSCSKELELLKGTWELLNKFEPIASSPDFKARFWQRLAYEEVSQETKPIFVFPGLFPRLVPAFATLGVILVISIYLVNSFLGASVGRLALLSKNEDIQMLQDLEILENFEIIQDVNTLEDFEIINSIHL